MKHCIGFGLVFAASLSAAPCCMPDSLLQRQIDSAWREVATECTWGQKITDTVPVYFGASFQSFDLDYASAKEVFMNRDLWDTLFQGFGLKKIPDPPNPGDLGTFYCEVRGPFSRNWFILNIDSIVQNAGEELVLYASQNLDSSLNAQYRVTYKRWINIENKGLIGRWYFRSPAPGKVRIGYCQMSETSVRVPGWLYRLAIHFNLPGVVEHMGQYLRRNVEARNNK